MSNIPETHELIKTGTASLHRAAEVQLDVKKVFSGQMSLKAYERLVLTHATVTAQVLQLASSAQPVLPDYTLRSLININDALSADLIALSLQRIPTGPLPGMSILNTAYAFGMAYVILGATHGSRILYPRLRSVPAIAGLKEYNYFKTCVDFPARHWEVFIDHLNREVNTEKERQHSLRGAADTFKQFIAVHDMLGH